jgi:hypothetical protein
MFPPVVALPGKARLLPLEEVTALELLLEVLTGVELTLDEVVGRLEEFITEEAEEPLIA